MKILVLGLDSAEPEILFGDERLTNIRNLMELGCFGKLKSVVPPEAVPAWMSMATSKDPGSLGIYGSYNRVDHTYNKLLSVNSKSVHEPTIWEHIAKEEKRSILIGVPPSYPPHQLNGICVGCYMTPDLSDVEYTFPKNIKDEIANAVGDYRVDVPDPFSHDKDTLKDQIFDMSRTQFDLVRYFLQHEQWDYFQFVDIGLERIQRGFWRYYDPQHQGYEPDNPYQSVILDYYLHLDQQLGTLFEYLDDETIVLVVSDHGAQHLEGGICVNEWLVGEGLLSLYKYPDKVTPFEELDVNWDKTFAWVQEGVYGRINLNVRGRELNGVIDLADYEEVREGIKSRLEAIPDDKGNPLGMLVFKPEEIYTQVRDVAPDLILHCGALPYRSIGSVGHKTIYAHGEESGVNGFSHSQYGIFILASANNPLSGEINGAHILDIAPTLLELAGYDIPASMQGKSLVSDRSLDEPPSSDLTAEEEAILRERLSGLGYIS